MTPESLSSGRGTGTRCAHTYTHTHTHTHTQLTSGFNWELVYTVVLYGLKRGVRESNQQQHGLANRWRYRSHSQIKVLQLLCLVECLVDQKTNRGSVYRQSVLVCVKKPKPKSSSLKTPGWHWIHKFMVDTVVWINITRILLSVLKLCGLSHLTIFWMIYVTSICGLIFLNMNNINQSNKKYWTNPPNLNHFGHP